MAKIKIPVMEYKEVEVVRCPYCGKDTTEIVKRLDDRFFVQCNECHACSPCRSSEELAVESWNRIAIHKDTQMGKYHDEYQERLQDIHNSLCIALTTYEAAEDSEEYNKGYALYEMVADINDYLLQALSKESKS